MKIFGIISAIVFGFFALFIVSNVLGWFSEATVVAREEFSPRAMLEKYEWFKDASAQLDKKYADIQVYQSRLTDMEKSYEGTKRKDWDRTDKNQYNIWTQEVAGTIASYNSLASEYNAQMAKFNYRFANKGELPQGALTPVQREYKIYITN